MNTQATSPSPPPMPSPVGSFDAAAWRLKLAGLTDPDYSTPTDGNASAAEHKQWAITMCLACCDLFGASLDRMTLWDRIPGALATACAKCDDGDIDRYVSLALSHIKADASRAARHIDIAALLYQASTKPASWRQGLVRYIATHDFSIVSYARRAWEQTKADRKDERVYKTGGELSTGEIVEKGGRANG